VQLDFRLLVYGYVVMPEHIHLLVSEPTELRHASASESEKTRPASNCPAQAKVSLEWATRHPP